MSLTLFELDEEIRLAEDQINAYAEEHEGDFTECPFTEILDQLQGDRKKKILNIAAWYKELDAEAKAVKAVEAGMARRRKALESKAEGLESYMKLSLETGEKLKDDRSQIFWRKSTSIEVASHITPETLGKMNSNYVKVKTEVDKTYLKDIVKSNGPIKLGEEEIVTIQENQNLQIK